MQSIWRREVAISARPALPGDLETEVAVIGAGMAGILTAYLLKRQGRKVVVVDAGRIAGGQTENTTAKITYQHDLIYDKLRRDWSPAQARLYAEAGKAALRQYKDLVAEHGIACDFEEKPAYVYSLTDVAPLEAEAAAARQAGIDASVVADTSLPFPVSGALRFDGQAQFNPLAFLNFIAQPLTIYERTRVRSVEDHTVHTDRGNITAEAIVMAAHYPFINMPGYYFMRQHQERSYVLALENAADLDGMYIDAATDGYSFRTYRNFLLLGGGSHRTGENSAGGRYEALRRAAETFFPGCREVARWSAQDCMTLDGAPFIGAYAAGTPHFYVATGFRKWGMTGSMTAAQILTDLITGRENPAAALFSPQRFRLSASAQTMLADGMQAVKGLGRSLLKAPEIFAEELQPGRGGIVDFDGDKAGVYKDENGAVFVVAARCSHMGCQLEWNPDEKSWDCPCHGSRFDYRGRVIDDPAIEDLEAAERQAAD